MTASSKKTVAHTQAKKNAATDECTAPCACGQALPAQADKTAPGSPVEAEATPLTPAVSDVKSLLVPPEATGERLDIFLSRALKEEGLSREKIKRAILEGWVQLNGHPCLSPKQPLPCGARLTITVRKEPSTVQPEEGNLEVLYKDAALLVLNKPAGLTVHPCPSCPAGTLVHRLLGHFPELAGQEGLRPGIVHRLDKDTSGLMLAALTEKHRLILAEAFAQRTVHKEYLALTWGVPKAATGLIDQPIGRHPTHKTKMTVLKGGRSALSEYRTLYAHAQGIFSLLAVRIHTGRTHQIRVHLAHLGHPIIGDALYGKAGPEPIAARQLLHAWRIGFTHPEDEQQLTFCVPPPPDFLEAALRLAHRRPRLMLTGLPGSGKSAVLAELRKRGLPVFSADDEVRALYKRGADGYRMLAARYGARFVPSDAPEVDRQSLFAAMSQDAALRREVEEFIHPMVNHRLEEFWRTQENSPPPAAEQSNSEQVPLYAPSVAEVPLFLESGSMRPKNTAAPAIPIILAGIRCPAAQRWKRLTVGRGWSDPMLEMMDSWQWPEDKKMAACDLLLDNSGDLDALPGEVDKLLASVTQKSVEAEKALTKLLQALWSCS